MTLAELDITDSDDPVISRVLLDGLLAHNARFAGAPENRPLSVVVRDPATGAVRGGLTGRTRYGWLYVDTFFLPEDLRGGGQGARILAAAEAEARARGCLGSYLDTLSFQAAGFYEKQGYARVGTLPDYPRPGQAKFFYMKRFDAA
jgi:GNAT superfamily N-acetyltransferase